MTGDRGRSIRTIVRVVSLLFTGVFAGFLLGVLVLENSLRGYDAAIYTQVRLVELDSLDTLATVTLIPALVCTAIAGVLAVRAKSRDRWLLAAAFALLLVVFVTSLAINVPINGDQVGWSVQTPPSDWASVRDRWQLAHLVRTLCAVLAFCSLTAATFLRLARGPRTGSANLQIQSESRAPTSLVRNLST
ncbi:anthrone oxygenase family protein [Nakamurella lactea]|uniref:anthrone oxygenase family protein n=1 Tax=Nakamurella lactea TaxID=459515 RepID=UPI0006872118|nr:anthrone oxygenase family protein [Nakamurella lactea]